MDGRTRNKLTSLSFILFDTRKLTNERKRKLMKEGKTETFKLARGLYWENSGQITLRFYKLPI